MGRLVTEVFNFDGGRRVTAYIPPDPPEAVIFTGDGQSLPPWGADLETLDLPPTLIVGVHRLPDEKSRLREYSPTFDPPTSDPAGSDPAGSDSVGSDSAGSDSAGSDSAASDPAGSDSVGSDSVGSDQLASDSAGFDRAGFDPLPLHPSASDPVAVEPARFAAHERFLVEDVRAWAIAMLGAPTDPAHTAVLGVSAGGELALALGIRHPDLYGTVLCASPGAGYRPPATLPGVLPRVYLVAGTREPFFHANATRWAHALTAGGADVAMHERPGAHGDPFWRQELPAMVSWAFRRPPREC